MKPNSEIQTGAKFSDCGKHRLFLYRIWDSKKPAVMFIGLNPSTADSTKDDPTIRRVRAMAANWGYGGVYMVNLFTFISTDPKLLQLDNGNLPDADHILMKIASRCEKIIFAWGNFKVMGRDDQVRRLFPKAYALHINKNGSPKHPLYVKGDVKPIPQHSKPKKFQPTPDNIRYYLHKKLKKYFDVRASKRTVFVTQEKIDRLKKKQKNWLEKLEQAGYNIQHTIE